jgi:hypothetical protein
VKEHEGRTRIVVGQCDEASAGAEPLVGWLPYNAVGEPLALWDGELSTDAAPSERVTMPGRIELLWTRSPKLRWSVDLEAADYQAERAWSIRPDERVSRAIRLTFESMPSQLHVMVLGTGRGESNGGSMGNSDAVLRRVVAHWINLPWFMGGERLHAHHGGYCHTWPGRSRLQVGSWNLTIDSRPDHSDAYREARQQDSCVMTHVMEVRRADGASFRPADAERLLSALQFGVSFAVGHWTCPAVPVGYDQEDRPVWTAWRPLFADPPRDGSGWWNRHRTQDLAHFLDVFVRRYLDADWEHALRLSATSAISAVSVGFVEQRLMTCAAALDLHSSLREAAAGEVEERDSYRRLSKVLKAAAIDLGVDQKLLPSLSTYQRQKAFNDGAKALVEIRHALVHPKADAELYAIPGLVAEASRLALRYLELALLHWLAYNGEVVDRTDRTRWAGESDPVPWQRNA